MKKLLIISLIFLTTIFCISTFSYATDDPKLRVYPETGLLGFRGLDDTSSPPMVQDGRASDIQNIKLDIDYSATKRYGYSLVVGKQILDIPDRSFAAVTGLYYTKLSTGTEYWVATCDNRFYYYTNSGSWTKAGQGITTGQNYQFVWATALDSIFGTNDYDAPIVWTGSGNYTTASFTGLTYPIQKTKCVVWWKNYLIWLNIKENDVERPTRMRFSKVGTINTYDDDDYIDIETLGGQEIEAIGILYDNLYIFFTNSIYKVSYVGGDELFNVSKVLENVGCIAKNSVQNISLLNQQEGLIFLDKKAKVYFFNGTTPQELSLLIRGAMDGLNDSRLPYAVSAVNGKDYYLSVSDGSATKNDLILDYEYEIGEWSKHDNIDSNAMYSGYDGNAVKQIYSGNYYNFVYKLDDPDLTNDIYADSTVSGVTGTIDAENTFTSLTASGLTVYYNSDASFTVSGLMGARLTITSGSAINEETIIADNTTTGIVVTSAITNGINATYSIGAIDAYYTTKWYNMGEPARRKQFQEMYFWAESGVSDDVSISYANDYSSTIGVDTANIATSGSLWGTAIWGTSTWGGVTTLMKRVKLGDSGRYLKLRFREPDIDDDMKLYGYVLTYVPLDVY